MHKSDREEELRRQFKNAFSSIHASEELKADTLVKMRSKTEPDGNEKKNYCLPVKKIWYFAVSAVLACGILILCLLRVTPGAPYLTEMESGVYYEEVQLKDGKIRFTANRVSISVSPNAGGILSGHEQNASTEGILEEKETQESGKLVYKMSAITALPEIDEENWSYIGEQKIYVMALKMEEMQYQAVFEREGQTFEIIGIGVTQREFIDYLYSIIKK